MMEVRMVAMAGVPCTVAVSGPGENRAQRSIRTIDTRPPVRLTRRGRIALTGVSALLIGVASVWLATAAQASHNGDQGAGRRYLARVEIRSGQNLWSVAEAYDPNADPRAVTQDIMRLNSLSGDQLQPGEVLWVPRS
jgi:LysM domain